MIWAKSTYPHSYPETIYSNTNQIDSIEQCFIGIMLKIGAIYVIRVIWGLIMVV